MNKLLLLLMILTAFCMLNATTLEVSLDGTHPYTTIQAAIDASNNGDTVLVHPGRYFENIDILENFLTLQSQYAITNNWEDVENTIIDASFQSNCIRIDLNSEVEVNGFSMTNGIGYNGGGWQYYGGAIFLFTYSQASIRNCIITNNTATHTGGIYCSENCELLLSGNVIRNNRGVYRSGGVSCYNATITFDSIVPNSIYNNYGDVQDIYLYNVTCNDIALDTLSVAITEPDGYFVSYYAPPLNTNPIPSISGQNSYFNQIDADIYVSPDGDDNNDGLTPETALSTIAYATRLIQPNEVSPNTVYLLPGTYSKELNDQFFPVGVQSNTKLLGAGETPYDVIIGDEWNINTVSAHYIEQTEIGMFKMVRNNGETDPSVNINRCNNIIVHDIDFGESQSTHPGIFISFSNTVLINNCRIHDIVQNSTRVSAFTSYCSVITINNLIVDSIYNNYEYGYISGIDLDDSSVTANNIIVTNNHQDYPGVIVQYANTASDSPGGNLNLSNFLMYNNTSTDNTQPMAIFINRYDPSYLNNMTIANNTSSSRVLRLNGDFTMRNSILYNPQAGSEMHLWDLFAGDPNPIYSNVDIDYCLIRNGESEIDGADHPQNSLTWGNHNIDTNPLFRGDVEGDIPVGDPRWLQLTPNSPCVNAGTPDTLGMNLPALDITGNPRVWDNIIDMGAHEYNPTVDNTENIQPALSNQIVVSHFPNPVTPNGKNSNVAFIEFSLQKKPIDKPTLEIFNIKGQKIRSIKITQSFSQLVRSAGLSSEEKQSGEYYSQVWDCKDNNRKQVASGIYFYKVSSGGDSAIGKMMVIK